jgi:hypothetical protein
MGLLHFLTDLSFLVVVISSPRDQLMGISRIFSVICYIITYYTACVLLFPDDLGDYKGFEDYFYSRKTWFFAVLAIIFGADTIDTLLKGKAYIQYWSLPLSFMK